MRNWWARSNLRFPEPRHPRFDSFAGLLEHLRHGYNFLNTPEACGEIAALYAARAAGLKVDSNQRPAAVKPRLV